MNRMARTGRNLFEQLMPFYFFYHTVISHVRTTKIKDKKSYYVEKVSYVFLCVVNVETVNTVQPDNFSTNIGCHGEGY